MNGVYEDRDWSLCEVNQYLKNFPLETQIDRLFEDEEEETGFLSQSGNEHHYFKIQTTPREFTKCICESCGEIQHVPSPLTCSEAICLQCDKEKSQFTKLVNIWTKRIKERNM